MPFPRDRPSLEHKSHKSCWGKKGADTSNVGTLQMGLAPLRWKEVLPSEIPAIASTLKWEDGIWMQSCHITKKVLRPCMVLCPLHAMPCGGSSENKATFSHVLDKQGALGT